MLIIHDVSSTFKLLQTIYHRINLCFMPLGANFFLFTDISTHFMNFGVCSRFAVSEMTVVFVSGSKKSE